MSEYILQCNNLTKSYGGKIALNSVSLTLKKGCVVGLLGPNGSGKTTFIKTVNGLLTPDSGNVFIDGISPGFETKKTKSFFKSDIKVIRAMPNTPAMVGEGMSVICHGDEVGEKEIQMAKCVFESVGKMAILPEKLLDSVVALNGSSPAYVFMFIEAMADGAVRDGIPRSLAYEIAAQSVLGSAKMVLETQKHPAELKDMVCSPGGTTIDAVAALEENGMRNAVLKAMQACTKKAKEMN